MAQAPQSQININPHGLALNLQLEHHLSAPPPKKKPRILVGKWVKDMNIWLWVDLDFSGQFNVIYTDNILSVSEMYMP